MKKVEHAVLARITALLVGLTVAGISGFTVTAQDPGSRPIKIDPGISRPLPKRPPAKSPTRPPAKNPPVSDPDNGLLIVLTEPDNAEVAIDGRFAGRAIDGIFRRELKGGNQYAVAVSAGPNYLPYKRSVEITAKQSQTVSASLIAKFGTVRVGPALDGARVLIDGKPADTAMLELDKNSNMLAINGLSPGVHKITYDHPAYAVAERTFTIEAGKEYLWTFAPELASVEMTVIAEPGTTIYVDKEVLGVVPESGKYKSVGVKIGKHEITLAKDGFEELSRTYDFEFNKPVVIAGNLRRLAISGGRPNTSVQMSPPSDAGKASPPNRRAYNLRVLTAEEFHEDFDRFDPKRWLLPPAGWAIRSGKLSLAGEPLVCSPIGARYGDFVMHFHLKLDNAGGAAWAARIKDARNYYLFYLSGPAGIFPNHFVVYVVRDGQFNPQQFVSSVPVMTRLAPGQEYDIELEAANNTFTHRIVPAATGKSEVLGYFQDANKLFPVGSFGFRTVGLERFSIDDIYVQPR